MGVICKKLYKLVLLQSYDLLSINSDKGEVQIDVKSIDAFLINRRVETSKLILH